MNQPSVTTPKKRGRPPGQAPKITYPDDPYRPYGPGSVLNIGPDSPTFTGRTVVVRRYLTATKSYAVHEEKHEARDGYVSREYVVGVKHAAPEPEPQAPHKVILYVPASGSAERESRTVPIAGSNTQADPPRTSVPQPVNGINLAALKLERYQRNANVKTSKHLPVLTFNRSTIGINGVAMERLGNPERMHLHFDAHQRVVAVETADSDDRTALKVQRNNKHQGGGKSGFVTALGFYVHFNLPAPAASLQAEAVIDGNRAIARYPVERERQ